MKRLVPALAAALAVTACTAPFFDPNISASVKTINASHLVGTSGLSIGPDLNDDDKPDFDLLNRVLAFIPERGDGWVNPGRGFVTLRDTYSSWTQVWYQWWDVDEVVWIDTPAEYDESDRMRWRWPVSLKGTEVLGAVIFDGSDLDTWTNRLWVNTVASTSDWFPQFDVGIDIQGHLSFGSEPIVLGLSLNPLQSGPDDTLHALVRMAGMVSEAEAPVNGLTANPTFVASFPPSASLPFMSGFRHVNYARDADPGQTRSFIQWIDSEGWHTVAWKSSGILQPTDIDDPVSIQGRIDAALTTDAIAWGWITGSYVLTTEQQVARVYRYNGIDTESLVAEFHLGDMYFVGQAYLDGDWQLLFTRSVVHHEFDPPQVHFETRTIRTRDLLNEFGR